MRDERVPIDDPHAFGREHFGDAYTVERREFADGDTRTLVIHTAAAWSATNYVQITVWCERGSVWREYYEHDRRRTRETIPFEEWDGSIHPAYD